MAKGFKEASLDLAISRHRGGDREWARMPISAMVVLLLHMQAGRNLSLISPILYNLGRNTSR